MQVSEKTCCETFRRLSFKDATSQLYQVSNGTVVLLGCCLSEHCNRATIVNLASSTISISECKYLLILASSLSLVMEYVSSEVFLSACTPRSSSFATPKWKSVHNSFDSLNPPSDDVISIPPTLSSRSFHRLYSASNIYSGIESIKVMDSESFRGSTDDISQHIVVVMVPSKSEYVSLEMLLVALICLAKPLRMSHPANPILVLSEQAQELSRLVSDIQQQLDNILQNTHFVLGTGTNPDHLASVHVKTCETVVVINPISKRIELPLAEYERILSDERVILVTLNLGVIREKIKFVAELVYHHNSSFLCFVRNLQPCGFPFKFMAQGESLVEEPYESFCPNQAQGFVLSHSMLDALLIQCVFSPALLSFWESIISQNSLAKIPVPQEMVGKPATMAFEFSLQNLNGIVIGIFNRSRESLVGICEMPLKSSHILESTDELFVLRF